MTTHQGRTALPLDPGKFAPAMREVAEWHNLMTEADQVTARTGLGMAGFWHAAHCGDLPAARASIELARTLGAGQS